MLQKLQTLVSDLQISFKLKPLTFSYPHGDLGLAKNNEECNTSTDVGKLPIKWSAPEALKNGVRKYFRK